MGDIEQMKITTDTDRNEFISRALHVDLSKHPWRFTAEPYKANRSLAQNSLSHKWYAELGKQSGNGKEYERNYCKWNYGCPILIENAKNTDFIAFYDKLINSYDYEQCLDAMGFVQITSLMKVKEFTEYLKHVEQYAAEQGYRLTQPDEYNEAMNIK